MPITINTLAERHSEIVKDCHVSLLLDTDQDQIMA